MHFPFQTRTGRRRKLLFTLMGCLLAVFLFGALFCFHAPFSTKASVDDAFRQFTLTLFRQEVSSNTINLHYTLKNPSDYGIQNSPVTFGAHVGDGKTVMASVENCQTLLKTFPYDKLSKENQLTYKVLDKYLTYAETGSEYLLYDEPLSPITGVQAQLPVLLAEYPFYTKKDVDTYLELLKTVPQYFDSLIDFEREKAEKGLFLSEEIVASVIEQCNSFVSMGKDNYLYSSFFHRLRPLPKLSDGEKAGYVGQNKKAIEDFLIPAYENLITALKELKGSGTTSGGLCNLPKGKDYYEYLVSLETGSPRTILQLKKLIQSQMLNDAAAMNTMLSAKKDKTTATAAATKFSLSASSEEILFHLQKDISSAFPPPADVTAHIKYVPKSMEPYLSPAFYLIPCIDDTKENIIYLNRAHTMDDLNRFTTLAHEGYPGHLYQTTYFAAKNNEPLRSLLNFGGYTEGWATYAEMCSYYLAPLPKKEAALAQKNASLILGLYAYADIGIHYDGWTLSDTIDFFSDYGITDKDTLSEIYELIVSDPANYLKYYVGYVEILELKKEAAKLAKEIFSQKDFHKKILDIGPAPFDIVREYVLF